MESTPARPRGPDRRRKPTNPLSLNSLFFGRRKEIRRSEDTQSHHYVDRYNLLDVMLFLGVILMSTTDCFLTLRLVAHGGEEINPVMDFFLKKGPLPFLGIKYTLTGLALFFLLVHKGYRFWSNISGRQFLIALNLLYVCLLVWEYWLLLKTHP